MKDISKQDKISKAIQNQAQTLLVLERFGIDLGFGDSSIEELCVSHQINPDLFLLIIRFFNQSSLSAPELSTHDILSLLEYLKRSHSYFIDEQIPKINHIIENTLNESDDKNIQVIYKFYRDYSNEVKEHIAYENDLVFPYINELILDQKTAAYSITEYKHHHTDIEEKLEDLKNLLIKYLPDNFPMKLRRQIFFELLELEKELNIHAHIEDHILIPFIENIEQK